MVTGTISNMARCVLLRRPALSLMVTVGAMLALLASALLLAQPAAASLPQPACGDTPHCAADDGLIEVSNPGQLHAIRYDLDGDGSPTNASPDAYTAAFPSAVAGMGYPEHTAARFKPGVEDEGILVGNEDRYYKLHPPPAGAGQLPEARVGQSYRPGPAAERSALVALYNATGGPNWTDNTNWLSDTPVGEWHGVTTDASGQVTELNLGENNLQGAIPTELGNLANLKELRLWRNELTGTLPRDVIRLTALEYLGFFNNPALCAPIDSAFQSWLQSIEEVYGSSCAAVDSSADRAVLVALFSAMGGANWTDDSNWRSDRPMREWLGVTTDANGRITGLILQENNLQGTLPRELTDLPHLETLSLWGNHLEGTALTWLSEMTNLKVLYLGDNELTGTIPLELGNLSSLRYLSLWGNQFTGEIPPQLGNLSNLKQLSLRGNQLTGPIPSELQNLTNLDLLYLWGNQLEGSVPAWLGNLSNLERLSLSGNQLTGPIPATLGNLSNLKLLNLNDNELTGPIPPQLGNLTNLTYLRLQSNELAEGTIPTWLGDLTNLEQLDLGSTSRTGTIPEELAGLSNLTHLSLYRNQLTGTLPPSLGNLSNLETLSLGGNDLEGPIPDALSRLSNLTRLYLWGNQLTGPIPAELGNLANLEVLQLDGNQLQGGIPTSLGRLSELTDLRLDRNRLGGDIPSELGNLANLERLELDQNQLTGSIPATLGNLVNLEGLWLHDNRLTGPIPAELGNLANLEVIHLRGNRFTGCIPADLQQVDDNDFQRLRLLFCGERPTQQTVDDLVVWNVGEQVSAAVEAEVREAVIASHDTYTGYGMPRIFGTITIFLYHDPDALEAAVKEVTGRTVDADEITIGSWTSSNGGFITVNASSERFQDWSSDARQRNIVGHMARLYNSLMSDLSTGAASDEVPPAGPEWLKSGAARYFTWQTLRPAGPESCDTVRSSYAGTSAPPDVHLREIETRTGYDATNRAWQLSFLAVELLAEQAGPEAVISYYASLWPGTTWPEAFQVSFGITVQEFYQLFEERRAAGFPRPDCTLLTVTAPTMTSVSVLQNSISVAWDPASTQNAEQIKVALFDLDANGNVVRLAMGYDGNVQTINPAAGDPGAHIFTNVPNGTYKVGVANYANGAHRTIVSGAVTVSAP